MSPDIYDCVKKNKLFISWMAIINDRKMKIKYVIANKLFFIFWHFKADNLINILDFFLVNNQ